MNLQMAYKEQEALRTGSAVMKANRLVLWAIC